MNSKKSASADLENKRLILMEVGMIITLVIVILTINWKTYEKREIQVIHRTGLEIPEEMVPITEQKPPEPQRVIPPSIITTINIVDDADPVDDDYFIDAGTDQLDIVEAWVPQVPVLSEEVNDYADEIFEVVESLPEYPGGDKSLFKFLGDNLVYPPLARETGVSGKVFLTFVVEKDGSITDVNVLRGIGGGCDEEAMRVVKLMPRWTPGKQRGIPVRVKYVFSVKFTLGLR